MNLENKPAIIWLATHVIFPMVPFIIGFIIRSIASKSFFNWEIFDAPELAICTIFLSLFVSYSLTQKEVLLEDEGKKSITRFWILGFIAIALASITFSGIITHIELSSQNINAASAEVNNEEFQKHCYELIILVLALLSSYLAIKVQQSFRLGTRTL